MEIYKTNNMNMNVHQNNNKLSRMEIAQNLWTLVGQSTSEDFLFCVRDVIKYMDTTKTATKQNTTPPVSPSTLARPQVSNVSFPGQDQESGQPTDIQKRRDWIKKIEDKYCASLIDDIKSLPEEGDTFEMEFSQDDFGKNDFGPKGKVFKKDGSHTPMYRWDNDVKYSLVWFFNTYKKSKGIQDKMSFKVEVPSVSEESSRKNVKVIFSNVPGWFDKKPEDAAMPTIERNVPISTSNNDETVKGKEDGPTFS